MEQNKLILTPDGWKHWILVQDFVEGDITVPAGFRTDLASVPRFLWAFIPPMGRYTQAVVVHDWMCANPAMYERKYADKVMYQISLKYKTRKWKARIMYIGVRIGAFLKW